MPEAKPSPLPNTQELVPHDIAHTLWYRGSRLHFELKNALALHPEIWHTAGLQRMLDEWDEIATRYASEVLLAAPSTLGTQEARIEALLQVVREYRERQRANWGCEVNGNDDYRCSTCSKADDILAAPEVVDSETDWDRDKESYGDFIASQNKVVGSKEEQMRFHDCGDEMCNACGKCKGCEGCECKPKVEEQDGEQELNLAEVDKLIEIDKITLAVRLYRAEAKLAALREPSKGLDSLSTEIPWDMPTSDRQIYESISSRAPEERTVPEQLFKKYADLCFEGIRGSDSLRERAIKAEAELESLSPKEPTALAKLQEVYDYFMGPEACGDFTCACDKDYCGLCEIRNKTKAFLLAKGSPSEPIEKDEVELELSQAVRLELFLSHACDGKYGDDGEMQCNARMPIDFKRDFPSEILAKSSLHRLMRAAAFNVAKVGSPSEGTGYAHGWNEAIETVARNGCFACHNAHVPPVTKESKAVLENGKWIHRTRRGHIACVMNWVRLLAKGSPSEGTGQ